MAAVVTAQEADVTTVVRNAVARVTAAAITVVRNAIARITAVAIGLAAVVVAAAITTEPVKNFY